MAKYALIVCLVALMGCAQATKVKRGLMDSFVGAISDVGSTFLPEETMRSGCASVGLYNREKDGSPPRRDASGGLSGTLGSGLARIGNTGFSRSGMEQGCINAGFYDKNLDAQGRPLNQGQGGGQTLVVGGQQQPETKIIYVNQPTPAPKKTYKCLVNGVVQPCDPRHMAQINQNQG